MRKALGRDRSPIVEMPIEQFKPIKEEKKVTWKEPVDNRPAGGGKAAKEPRILKRPTNAQFFMARVKDFINYLKTTKACKKADASKMSELERFLDFKHVVKEISNPACNWADARTRMQRDNVALQFLANWQWSRSDFDDDEWEEMHLWLCKLFPTAAKFLLMAGDKMKQKEKKTQQEDKEGPCM
jgi:hypothetical protein